MDSARGEAQGPLRPTASKEPRREELGAGFLWRLAGAWPLGVGGVGLGGLTLVGAAPSLRLHTPALGCSSVWPREPHTDGDATPPSGVHS